MVWRLGGIVVFLALFAAFFLYASVAGSRPDRRVLAFLLAVGCSVGALALARWLRRPQPAVEHVVTIVYGHPVGSEPFYLANCDCGWVGNSVGTEDEARADAAEHSPKVRREVERPLET